jgi:hypothetical protein
VSFPFPESFQTVTITNAHSQRSPTAGVEVAALIADLRQNRLPIPLEAMVPDLLQAVNAGKDAGQLEPGQPFAMLLDQAPVCGQMYPQSLLDGEFDNIEDIFSNQRLAARNIEMPHPHLPHLANQPGDRFEGKSELGPWMGRGFAMIAGEVTGVGQQQIDR